VALDGLETHAQNSSGILDYGGRAFSVARPGLMLYGVSPTGQGQELLRPALQWKSRVALARELPAGHGISYGRAFVTTRPTRIATIACGYADGYPRSLSGQGAEVLIGGQRCPLLGRVTMDLIMADVTHLQAPAREGDEVVLLGRQGSETVTATELARLAGTIPWEIFTNISARVPRFPVD
jgi:alanine racemase